MKVVTRILIAVCILSLTVNMLGCVSGGPSKADVEEAVLRTIAKNTDMYRDMWGESNPYHYEWVRQVEVMDIGTPWTLHTIIGDIKYWPVKVYLIGDQPKEEIQTDVYEDSLANGRRLLFKNFAIKR